MSTTTQEHYSPLSFNDEEAARAYIDRSIANMEQGFDTPTEGTYVPEQTEVIVAPEAYITSTVSAPEGFSTTERIEAENEEVEELGRVKLSLRQLAKKPLGLPTLGATWAYGKLFDRSVSNWKKFDGMSAKDKIAHVEKMGRFGGRAATVGLAGMALYAITKTHPSEWLPSFESASLKTFDPSRIELTRTSHDLSSVTADYGHGTGADGHIMRPDINNLSNGNKLTVNSFNYDPNLDPGSAKSGKIHNDFGPALRPDAMDAEYNKPAGFYDMVHNHWPKSPKEFAAVLSKFGKFDNNSDAINQAGDYLAKHPDEFEKVYAGFLKELDNCKIEVKQITTPYGSYYMVDNGNGKLTLAYDNYVNHGGTMYVITTPDGKTVCLRMECGGQPIDIVPQPQYVPASPEVQHYAASQPQPVHEQAPPTPETQTPPEQTTPPTDTTPPGDTTPPPTNTTPPGGTTPEEHKGDGYIKDKDVVSRGPNKFEVVPRPVETTTVTQGQEGIAQAAIIDNHKVAPHRETGGASEHHDAPIGQPGVSSTIDSDSHSSAVAGPQ